MALDDSEPLDSILTLDKSYDRKILLADYEGCKNFVPSGNILLTLFNPLFFASHFDVYFDWEQIFKLVEPPRNMAASAFAGT
jgi:hypothetical protein